ncbi:MAG: response regulator [Planctomycetes bacterium]|nr:response regulator [Planctomycetota bacterium]
MDKQLTSDLKSRTPLPDPSRVSVKDVLEDMWGTYRDAVGSLLSELEAAAMAVEAGTDADDNAALIRRLLHSIKGDSGMSGLPDVHDMCHAAESVFEELTDNVEAADMVLRVKDWIEAVINFIETGDIVEEKQQQQVEEKNKLRVLVIDDDTVCRTRLKSILNEFFDVSFAEDGQAGLEEYIKTAEGGEPYDLITLDINMPRMNGHETLAAIRQYEEDHGVSGLDGIKIVMTTSEDDSKQIFKAFRQGCEAYVTKSGMGDKLLDEVAKLGLLKVVKVQKDYAVG